MLVLDTDHVVLLQQEPSTAAVRLATRLRDSGERVATTIVSVEEQARGWLAAIHRETKLEEQIRPYARFQMLFQFFGSLLMLSWDVASVAQFETLKTRRVRIGTMDLKIASIAIVHDAVLLMRNTVDFEKVPGLKFEDWIS